MKIKRFLLYGFSKSFLLKIILALLIILGVKNVFAASYNVTNKINDDGTFAGVDISSGIAIPNVYHVNTRYNGILNQIDFYINADDWDWQYNKTYTITLTMATEDWRNHFMGPVISDCNSIGNCSSFTYTRFVNGSFRFISQKKISFNFKTGSTMLPYLKFTIYSGSGTTGMTGVTNFNLNSVTISTTSTVTPTPVPSTPTPTPAPTPTPQPNNQDIINNQTQNTQDIINNNNTNTNSIINNQTQNTQDIIDNSSQNTSDIIENANNNTDTLVEHMNDNSTCPSGDLQLTKEEFGDITGYLQSDGTIYNTGNYSVSPYLKIKPNTDYKIKFSLSTTTAFYCFYNGNKELVSCSPLSPATQSFTTNSSTYYMRVSLRSGRVVTLTGPVCNDWQKEAMQKIGDVAADTNSWLKDDSNPTMNDSTLTNVFGQVGFSDPLNYLLTLPTQLINKIVSSSNSCSTIDFGTLLGTHITFPCIDIESIVGSSVWSTIDILFAIGLLVNIFRNLYHTFANLLTLGAEKEARDKFSMPTPMDFLASILGGGKE